MGNKANLRDLIAATGLVILLKLDSNRFFGPYDLEIWWMTSKNNRTPHLCYINISKPLVNSNWSYSLATANSCQNQWFFVPCDLEIRCMALINDRAPLLSRFKLCASFRSHLCIQTGVTVRKHPNWDKICFYFVTVLWPLTLTFCMDIIFVNGNNSWKISWWYADRNTI